MDLIKLCKRIMHLSPLKSRSMILKVLCKSSTIELTEALVLLVAESSFASREDSPITLRLLVYKAPERIPIGTTPMVSMESPQVLPIILTLVRPKRRDLV